MTSSHRPGLSARCVTHPLFSRRMVALMLAAVILLVGMPFERLRPPTRAAARPPAAQADIDSASSPQDGPRQGAASLAGVLDEDGSLRLGINGSFDTSGFRMELSPAGAPRFVAEPACSGWDTQFSVPDGVDGTVSALAVSGTDIYVGGVFKTTSTAAANNVGKFDTTTDTWSKLGIDGNGVNGQVRVLAVSGSTLYLGGAFTQANVGGAAVAVNRVAKFDTTTNTWSKLGSDGNGVGGFVISLALSGSALYVGGIFTQANVGGAAITANRVAKFDTTTGTWSKLGTDGNGVSTQSFHLGMIGEVNALAAIGDTLYVGGIFQHVNFGGTAVEANNVAKFDMRTNTWGKLGTDGSGVTGQVMALAVNGSDLYVGGAFKQANVGGTAVETNNIARFDTTSNTWSKLGTDGNGVGENGGVSALVVSGSDLYVGGAFFTQANFGGTAVGANNVARFDMTTNAWDKLGTDGNGVNDGVSALVVSGSTLYLGGAFTQANVGGTAVGAKNLAKFDTTTGIWSRLAATGGNGMSHPVFALAVSGTDIYVGGDFTAAGNVAANRVAKFDTTTNAWSKLGTVGNGVNGRVRALAVNGGALFVGGQFTQANVGGAAVAVNRVAKFDTTTNTWGRLGTDGNGVDGEVFALAVSGSSLYVGGEFSLANVGGTTVHVDSVARFDTTTNTWGKLGTDGSGVNGTVRALAASGGALFVGGVFQHANNHGMVVEANNVAKFDTTTNTWSKLGTDGNGVHGDVDALAVSGGSLYVGGYFQQTNYGGTVVEANNVARFDTTTNTWGKLGADGNGVTSSTVEVFALAVSGGTLYVGGVFQQANAGGAAFAVKNVARLDMTTNSWGRLGTDGDGVDGTVSALAVSGGGGLFVGGSFTLAGENKLSLYIGRLCDAVPPAVTVNQAAGQSDPTGTSPVNFTVVFSEPVSGFTAGDVTLGGSAGATTANVTGSGTTYHVAVGGMTTNGTVTASISAGVATDAAGNLNDASTSADNAVTFTAFPASVIEFARSPYTVAERDGSVAVTVRRSGDVSQPAAVGYSTDDGGSPSAVVPCSSTAGLALERCDYERAAGTLRFAAGEVEKTFAVLVNDDSYAEGTETAHLRLSNPSGGAALGPRSSAALEITDDAQESAGNPIDEARDFVRQHYRDFLGREPDPQGFAFWTDQMTDCGNPNPEVCRVNVSAAFFLSIEFQQTGYFVERMYKAAYGDAAGHSSLQGGTIRVPAVRFDEFMADTQEVGRNVVVGQGDWQRQSEANKRAFALEFVRRQRFRSAFPPSMTADEVVSKLDGNAGGVLSAEGKALLTATLGPDPGGDSERAEVLLAVSEDAALARAEFDRAFVLMQYFGYLRRDPDAAPAPCASRS
jgi:hypothetical protein